MVELPVAKLYMHLCKLANMGGRTALTFLEALRKHDALSTSSLREYVLRGLCDGREASEGTPRYAELERGLYQHIGARRGDQADSLSTEAAAYLHDIISTALEDSRGGLPELFTPYDGYSRRAYEEVYRALGAVGRRYLGVSGLLTTLVPSHLGKLRVREAEYVAPGVLAEEEGSRGDEAGDALPDMPVDLLPETPIGPLSEIPDTGLPGWADDSLPMSGGYGASAVTGAYR